ncbi:MAG: hypothetical protein KC462_04665, partial [Cyanobacteria bacterium HKST-UBA05]|nr:hypothetical protein [Cyanobacteria bacterium HKST-UBA05]
MAHARSRFYTPHIRQWINAVALAQGGSGMPEPSRTKAENTCIIKLMSDSTSASAWAKPGNPDETWRLITNGHLVLPKGEVMEGGSVL